MLRLDILLRETAVTFRSLRREIVFTVGSVSLLALGIGLTSAVFALLWQVVYAQLPVPDPGQLFTFTTDVTHMGRAESDSPNATVVSAPAFRYIAQKFTAASATIARSGQLLNLETPAGSRHVRAELVSGNFFAGLRVAPVVGRAILPEDDTSSAPNDVAVLSYVFWKDAFGGDVAAIDRSTRVNGASFRIVGIAPPDFTGLLAGQSPQIYLPLSAKPLIDPGWHATEDWSVRWLNIFFRVRSGTPVQSAEAQLSNVYSAASQQELASEPPQPADYLKELSHEHIRLVPASQGLHGMFDSWRQPLYTLEWLTGAVLFLACINLAGLAVVRALKQKQEIRVRYALGASRAAVARLYLLQSAILAALGGLLAIWFARVCSSVLVHLARIKEMEKAAGVIPGSLHWFAVLAAGLLIGIFPAWHAARRGVASSVRLSTESQPFTRRALAAVQVAVSLALLIAAGLFAKSLHNLTSVPVGFNPERLTLFSVDPKLAGSTAEAAHMLYTNLASAIDQTPGVRAVAYGTGGPFPQGMDFDVLVRPPKTSGPKQKGGGASVIGPHYFAALGVPILQGREFDQRDRAGTPRGIIINQPMARQLFPNENAVGQQVLVFNGLDPNWLGTIIGVAADFRGSWKHSGSRQIFTAAQQSERAQPVTFYVRSSARRVFSEASIRELVRRQAPMLAPFDIQTMTVRMDEFASRDRAMALLIAAFAAIALLISVIGIYGVVAYSARMRTIEFGVRVALGARRQDVLWLVLREAMWIVSAGLILAIPAIWLAVSLARNQLYQVTLHDPGILCASALALILCTLAAAAIPALRITQIDVHAVLRHN